MEGDQPVSIPGLFDEVLGLPPEQRAAYLDRACRGQPEARRQVEGLLRLLDDARTDDLFPALRADPAAPSTGGQIGPYRILRELGAGGMGVVFLAEREDLENRVALKLVREGGLASPDRVRRFLRERRVLARLEHPHIARLLDAGVTESRLPWFAMEYVEGTPIDRYCDERRLPVVERLALFRTVCEAVHHAHRNLVVHRDLKPSNILVTSRGQVKLLDFGIAKLLAGPEAGETEEPRTELLLLTPEYASPEQVRGEPVTTASDVYSLGVILYQLLTGYRPYRLAARTPAEIERVVCGEMPDPPSLAAGREGGVPAHGLHLAATPENAALARGTVPDRLRRALRGDLDTIVLRALHKEPGRRYDSAAQLSEDLRRHLDGLPVLARRDTAAYRAAKFLRRHRAGVAAAGGLLALLVAGIVATAWQARRAETQRAVAEERFRDVHGLATAVVFDIHDAIADLPGTTRARALVVQRGLDYLQRLSRQSYGDRDLQRETAEAFIRLGMAQGYPSGANLGDLEGARASLEQALALAEPLVSADSNDRLARRTLALAHEKLGDVKAHAGQVEMAVEHAHHALGHWAHLAAVEPGSTRARLAWAISTIKLGDLLGHPLFPSLNDPAGAERQYRAALQLLETAPPDSASDWNRRRQVALTHERLSAMFRLEGRRDEAVAALERSLGLRMSLAGEDRTSSEAIRDVAVSRESLCGLYLERGDTSDALGQCRAAVSLYQDLHAADPGNAQGVTDYAIARSALADILAARGEWTRALTELREGAGLLRRALADNPEQARTRRELGRILLRSSTLQSRLVLNRRGAGVATLEGARAAYAEGRQLADDEDDRELASRAARELARAVAQSAQKSAGSDRLR